jgi:hypothetical protein
MIAVLQSTVLDGSIKASVWISGLGAAQLISYQCVFASSSPASLLLFSPLCLYVNILTLTLTACPQR